MRTAMWFAVAAFLATVASPLEARDAPKEAILCPVMGMPVPDPDHAPRSVHQGRTYYFCCPSCKEKFDKDPERYLRKAGMTRQEEGTCAAGSRCESSGHAH